MFTHTHLDDGREHVTCTHRGDCTTRPHGDRRGIDDWKHTHTCHPPQTDNRRDAA